MGRRNDFLREFNRRNRGSPESDQALKKIQECDPVVVGAGGGVGFRTTTTLCQCGAGSGNSTLYAQDFDVIEVLNLNRGYEYRDVGRPKVEVVAERCRAINPFCRIVPIMGNVMLPSSIKRLGDIIHLGRRKGNKVIFINNTDRKEAGWLLSDICGEHSIPLIHGGASPDSRGFFVQVFIPGRTACVRCVYEYFMENPEMVARKRRGCEKTALAITMNSLADKMMLAFYRLVANIGTTEPLMLYNIETENPKRIIIPPNEGCAVCGTKK